MQPCCNRNPNPNWNKKNFRLLVKKTRYNSQPEKRDNRDRKAATHPVARKAETSELGEDGEQRLGPRPAR